ncbi:cysteine-rich receptor-like protein kinase 15 [Chenopodium quinoa]|uniref:cysteine-rich receptor-like protein kinase 15 n=1 Tax=Chenopodium quinoa TaxID=63459 RepID=UPI000B77F759|nr:cysteine-rich receptor-like protein kinase 15 [Chenopodium quinoa]
MNLHTCVNYHSRIFLIKNFDMANYVIIFSVVALAVQMHLFLGEAATFTIANNCGYIVWPVIQSTNGASLNDGFSLTNGSTRVIIINISSTGRLWGRTHCTTNSLTGNFSCLTGDCGTGKMDCQGRPYTSPVTLVEFATNQINNYDFYDISVVDGYNLPVAMAPSSKGGIKSRCAVTGCVFNYDHGCPDELKVTTNQTVIGCRSPCDVFHTNESCCTNANDCRSNSFSLGSLIFKKACPRAYSYTLDDQTSTFDCPGDQTSYEITFCPSLTLASAVSQPLQSPSSSPSVSPSSLPTPKTPTTNSSPTNIFPRNTTKPRLKSVSKRKRTILLIALSISIALSILLLYGIWTCIFKRKVIKTTTSSEVSEIKKVVVDSLQYDLNTIRIATNNFAAENKLGEGGFGEVYKGKIENGQEIAVKRLSKNSGQGVVEFKTEVDVVAKLRHKNLVKLLGFCVALEEKILVYEFLPNSSLDRFLFDQTKNVSLDWQTRFKIIIGIAKGLLYLHEDSPLKIIHRDLKSSNVLLDDDMNPKISDFGLAKLFGVDQTQGDTKRIVGTYGYMAPEYAITGHYSVKSDVFSFGVLVLEIVSGQRNRFFGRLQLEEALLHRAWRLWNEEKTLDLVDTTLDSFPIDEVTKCIHIGLLCIQEEAVVRPRMASIVAALNGQALSLPVPKPPHFFGTDNNVEDNEMQYNFQDVYTGTTSITELYPRN